MCPFSLLTFFLLIQSLPQWKAVYNRPLFYLSPSYPLNQQHRCSAMLLNVKENSTEKTVQHYLCVHSPHFLSPANTHWTKIPSALARRERKNETVSTQWSGFLSKSPQVGHGDSICFYARERMKEGRIDWPQIVCSGYRWKRILSRDCRGRRRIDIQRRPNCIQLALYPFWKDRQSSRI